MEHRERVVSRDELLEHCWSTKYITDGALSRCLSRLRYALGQTDAAPRLIETVHCRGYRFVAEVRESLVPQHNRGHQASPWHRIF